MNEKLLTNDDNQHLWVWRCIVVDRQTGDFFWIIFREWHTFIRPVGCNCSVIGRLRGKLVKWGKASRQALSPSPTLWQAFMAAFRSLTSVTSTGRTMKVATPTLFPMWATFWKMDAVAAVSSIARILSLVGQALNGIVTLRGFYQGCSAASRSIQRFLKRLNELI